MSHIAVVERAGTMPGQAHDDRFDMAIRPIVTVARVVGFDDETHKWIVEKRSKGDLLGFNLWKRDLTVDVANPAHKRTMSGWATVWPTIVSGFDAGDNIKTTGGQAANCVDPGDGLFHPIFDDSLHADERFEPKTLKTVETLDQKFPQGFLGLTLSTTIEVEQQELFFPVGSCLLAPNRGGVEEMGTPVYDVDQEGKLDREIFARLQSTWIVLRPRGGPVPYKDNVLAWQMGPAGCNEDGWGFIHDGVQDVSAVVNVNQSGPFDVGGAGDKHLVALTEEGRPINSAHIHTNTYFINQVGDAPIEFDTRPYGQPKQFPFVSRAWIRYDANAIHSHITGQKDGLWRLVAETPFYIPSARNVPPIKGPPPQDDPPNPSPPGPGDGKCGGQGGENSGGQDFPPPQDPDGDSGKPPTSGGRGGVPNQDPNGKIQNGKNRRGPDTPGDQPSGGGGSGIHQFPRFPEGDGIDKGSSPYRKGGSGLGPKGRELPKAPEGSKSPTGPPGQIPKIFPKFPEGDGIDTRSGIGPAGQEPSRIIRDGFSKSPTGAPGQPARIFPRFPNSNGYGSGDEGSLGPQGRPLQNVPPGSSSPTGGAGIPQVFDKYPSSTTGGRDPAKIIGPPTYQVYDPSSGHRDAVATTMDLGLPSINARPQRTQDGVPDLRNSVSPGASDIGEVDGCTPMTGRLEAFGAEGGLMEGSAVDFEGEPTGAPFDVEVGTEPWDYTTPPCTDRWPGGVANGGFALMTADIDMADFKGAEGANEPANPYGDHPVSPRGSKPESYITATPGTWFATGLPDTRTGEIANGAKIGDDGHGNMIWYAHRRLLLTESDYLTSFADSTEVIRPVMRIKTRKHALEILNPDAGGGAARFDAEGLTTTRTFTFPNQTGTFAISISSNGTSPRFNDLIVDDNLALKPDTLTLVADANNLNLNASSAWGINPSGANRTITGIDDTSVSTFGPLLVIYNTSATNNLIFTHQDAASTSFHRIITTTGASVTLTPSQGAFFLYDPVPDRWRLLFTS